MKRKQSISEKRSIKSKKLDGIIKQHGGIETNRGIFDIANLKDDDIIGVVDYDGIEDAIKKNTDVNNRRDEIEYIRLKDGKFLIARCRGCRFDRVKPELNQNREEGDFQDLWAKKEIRRKNIPFRRNEYYNWNNKDAEDIFKNPYYREGIGGWNPKRKKEIMKNIKNGKRWWEREDESNRKLGNIISETVSRVLKKHLHEDEGTQHYSNEEVEHRPYGEYEPIQKEYSSKIADIFVAHFPEHMARMYNDYADNLHTAVTSQMREYDGKIALTDNSGQIVATFFPYEGTVTFDEFKIGSNDTADGNGNEMVEFIHYCMAFVTNGPMKEVQKLAHELEDIYVSNSWD